MEKQNYIEVSYTSVADMLQKMKDQLVEMKKDHERQVEAIKNDIRDCDKAIAALTQKVEVAAEQPQEPTERLPKVGDQLVWTTESTMGLEHGKSYHVIECSQDSFTIEVIVGRTYGFQYKEWKDYFRFADEPTSEDLANLHSYLHVNNEKTLDITEGEHDNGGFAKKPYRIKTRQEMINGGGVEHDGFSIHQAPSDIPWVKDMDYLQGMELETNNLQYIQSHNPEKYWTISPWMITENN